MKNQELHLTNKEIYKNITNILNEMGVVYTLLIGENDSDGVHAFTNVQKVNGSKFDKMCAAEKFELALHTCFEEKFKETTSS
jgi:hypothetical protein